MEGLLFTLLILMIPLGIAQVISALVIVIFTDNKPHREHFAYYLGGVVAYFIILYTLAMTGFSDTWFMGFYFFAGALGLAFFHLSIFFRDSNRDAYHRRRHQPNYA